MSVFIVFRAHPPSGSGHDRCRIALRVLPVSQVEMSRWDRPPPRPGGCSWWDAITHDTDDNTTNFYCLPTDCHDEMTCIPHGKQQVIFSWSGVLFWFLQKADVWKVVPTYLQNILLTSFWITVIMHICLVDYSSFTVFYQRRQIRFLIVFLTLIPSCSIPSRRTVAYRCRRWIDSPAHRACRKRWLWRRHPNLIESSDLFTLCSLPSRGYCWAGAHTHTAGCVL